ncbi:HlyD family secretion protein [Arhodomonas aquaeolei]|uniref:HlyD family secretion protein n=1 Tax=Arhodomonas aquaeolei TaxID=2369 RepID=UPI000376AF53|nr:HlyD family efflux transporter periplasmic adaptor subunit [Arhodomonas aquaeolei]
MKAFWKWTVTAAVAVAVVGMLGWQWWQSNHDALPAGFAGGNGRIEAVEVDVATKIAGRIREIEVDEGDFVTRGQVLARMDTATLEAQLDEAQAQLRRARVGVETAGNVVKQRRAERSAAQAVVAQRRAELDAARLRLNRSESLAPKGAVPQERLDDDRASFQASRAAVAAAEAQVAAAEANVGAAESGVIDAEAAVAAAQATVQRIQADIDDSVLKSPTDGRIQYRVAEPGEVLGAGGRVLNLVDLTNVYMTFFLPTAQAGRVAMGTEARLVLDAAPQYVIPATVTFVADVAQFTPKTVETEEERQKLMFRVKARIDPGLLREHITQVKTGLPGMGYVRLDSGVEWPEGLQAGGRE